MDILDRLDWDIRILGEEYRDRDFTGRKQSLDKCYFNKRSHSFSSSELRERVADKENKKTYLLFITIFTILSQSDNIMCE